MTEYMGYVLIHDNGEFFHSTSLGYNKNTPKIYKIEHVARAIATRSVHKDLTVYGIPKDCIVRIDHA